MAETQEEVQPSIVQRAGFKHPEEVTKKDKNLTPSARSEHWGVGGADRNELDEERASREDQVGAFGDYQDRPDIESRKSILAREQAYPAQFSEENVASGSVDDSLTRDPQTLELKESKEAKKQSKSIGNVTAKQGD